MKNKYPIKKPYIKPVPHLVTSQATENKKGSFKIESTKATEELEVLGFEKLIFTKVKNHKTLMQATTTPQGMLKRGGCSKVK